MGDEIPGSVHLNVNDEPIDSGLSNLMVVDQLGELLVSPVGAGSNSLSSVPLRLVPVGDGQFLLAKIAQEDLGSDTLDGDKLTQTSDHSPSHEEPVVPTFDEEDLRGQLAAIQSEILARLECLSEKLDQVGARCRGLGDKMLQVTGKVRASGMSSRSTLPTAVSSANSRTGVTVCVPSPAGGSVEDYPNGSWLGDPADPETRVRVPILYSDLEMLNRTCATPEKMALTLLDFLFDREVQATSNISGTGRHGKRQLDPLRIFGIRCHLVYQFGIGDQDWHRIKQNLDSKCRTAFRRKHRGMSLSVKAFRDRVPSAVGSSHEDPISPVALGSQSDTSLDQTDDLDLSASTSVPVTLISGDVTALQGMASVEPQIIRTEHGDIQVVQATAEQLAQMEGDPRIHILASAEVLSGELQHSSVDQDLQP